MCVDSCGERGQYLHLHSKNTKTNTDTDNVQVRSTIVATPPPSASPAKTAVEPGWSAEQQAALEQALQKFPASTGSTRWDRIAEHVTGKSRAECVARYKGIVAALKAKKAAAIANTTSIPIS